MEFVDRAWPLLGRDSGEQGAKTGSRGPFRVFVLRFKSKHTGLAQSHDQQRTVLTKYLHRFEQTSGSNHG